MSKNCPVCDRPPGDSYRDGETVCGMWWTLQGRRCVPSYDEFLACYNRAKPLRELADRQAVEIADLKTKLAGAQRALSRHHAKVSSNASADMFPDNARIE